MAIQRRGARKWIASPDQVQCRNDAKGWIAAPLLAMTGKDSDCRVASLLAMTSGYFLWK